MPDTWTLYSRVLNSLSFKFTIDQVVCFMCMPLCAHLQTKKNKAYRSLKNQTMRQCKSWVQIKLEEKNMYGIQAGWKDVLVLFQLCFAEVYTCLHTRSVSRPWANCSVKATNIPVWVRVFSSCSQLRERMRKRSLENCKRTREALISSVPHKKERRPLW